MCAWAVGCVQGAAAPCVALLTHPMEEPAPVLADVSLHAGFARAYSGWAGERVVWAHERVPLVVTYSEVREGQRQGSAGMAVTTHACVCALIKSAGCSVRP